MDLLSGISSPQSEAKSSGFSASASTSDLSTEASSVTSPNLVEDSTSFLSGEDSSKAEDSEEVSQTLLDPQQNFGTSNINEALALPCTCGHIEHSAVFNAEIPIIFEPGVVPGSYEETLKCAKSLCGHWVTILDRSQSLDPQLRHVGVNVFKRAIMNRLAVPLSLFLEDECRVLHVHIHTPIGIRHMICDLTGATFVDNDPDAGRWQGTARMVDYSIPWFCGGRPVRALQQVRRNEKAGWSVETRCILPDAQHGRVMLFNFTLISHGPMVKRMSADRVLKFVRPVEDKS